MKRLNSISGKLILIFLLLSLAAIIVIDISVEIYYSETMVPVIDLRNKILFLVPGVLIILLVILIIYFIARRINRTIINIKNAAEKIGLGEFDTQLQVKSNDEIGALAVTFNQMALQLKTMTNNLKDREERLIHFYDATLDGIVLHDNERPLMVNHAMVKLTGYTEQDLMNMNITEIFHHEKSSAFRLPLRPYTYETNALSKNKKSIPVEIQVSTIEYRGKMILASVIRDISRRMEIEKELQKERLKRLSWVIDGQEIERERLARELHDGLGQMLVAIKLKLESTVDHEDEKTKAIISDLRNMFDKTIDEIRRISNDLMPSGLQEFGIVNALRKLGNVISENKSIKVEVEAQNIPDQLDPKTLMYIYRITQEAITNSVKHAQASQIWIKLTQDEHFISLLVGDNGKGFKFDKTHKFVGNGIYNMRERANMMNGTIEIKSEPGKGTTVFVQIPIIKNQ
jgi:PAS domain S-box-containing protein